MAVTDSIVCNTGCFIPSSDIHTPYNKLNSILQSFDWECDYKNGENLCCQQTTEPISYCHDKKNHLCRYYSMPQQPSDLPSNRPMF